MKTVEIAPGVHSSILGFGCAPVLGSVGASVSRRAIDCALDCGITHFDLARSYGYGEAEAFVGKILKNQRNKVVLASKFGIRANFKAKLLRPVKPIVRSLMTYKKSKNVPTHGIEEGAKPRVADRFHDRITINGMNMVQSLECSLRALRTEYLDILFVHEPLESLMHVEEVLETGSKLKREGKIRALGLAITWDSVALHSNYLARFDILQCDNSFGSPTYPSLRHERASESNIFFSPLRNRVAGVKESLTAMWKDFPESVILCSMFKENHIQENARYAAEFT